MEFKSNSPVLKCFNLVLPFLFLSFRWGLMCTTHAVKVCPRGLCLRPCCHSSTSQLAYTILCVHVCVCEVHACVCDTGTSIRIELVVQRQQHWFNQIQATPNIIYSVLMHNFNRVYTCLMKCHYKHMTQMTVHNSTSGHI